MLIKPVFSRMFFDADNGNGEGGGANGDNQNGANANQGTNAGADTSGGNGKAFEPITSQEALDAIVTKRLSRQEQNLRKTLTDEIRQALKDEAETAAATEQGNYKKLYDELQPKYTDLGTKVQTAEERITKYEALIAPIVTERLDALKAANADVAKGFPADADVLAQLDWLNDPRTKALIDAQASKADNLRKWPNTVKPNADTKPTDEDAKRAQARIYRDF